MDKKTFSVNITNTINDVRKEITIKKAKEIYDAILNNNRQSNNMYKKIQSFLNRKNDLFSGKLLIYKGFGFSDSEFIRKKTSCIEAAVIDTVLMLRSKYSEEYVFAIYRTGNPKRIQKMENDIKKDIKNHKNTKIMPVADKIIIGFVSQVTITFNEWYKALRKRNKCANISEFYLKHVFADADARDPSQILIISEILDQLIIRTSRVIRLIELSASDDIIGDSYGLLYLSLLFWTHDELTKAFMK